jgi:integrase/recombinase XerD
LLEEGVNIRVVSGYLGHAHLEQTVVYLHLTEASEAKAHEALARMLAPLQGIQGR